MNRTLPRLVALLAVVPLLGVVWAEDERPDSPARARLKDQRKLLREELVTVQGHIRRLDRMIRQLEPRPGGRPRLSDRLPEFPLALIGETAPEEGRRSVQLAESWCEGNLIGAVLERDLRVACVRLKPIPGDDKHARIYFELVPDQIVVETHALRPGLVLAVRAEGPGRDYLGHWSQRLPTEKAQAVERYCDKRDGNLKLRCIVAVGHVHRGRGRLEGPRGGSRKTTIVVRAHLEVRDANADLLLRRIPGVKSHK